MSFNDFLKEVLFNIGNHDVTVRQLISWGIVLVGTFLIYQLVIKKVLPKYFAQEKYVIRKNSRILRSIRNIFILIALIGTVWSLEIDFLLYQMKNVGVRVSTVLYALTIWQVAGMWCCAWLAGGWSVVWGLLVRSKWDFGGRLLRGWWLVRRRGCGRQGVWFCFGAVL